MWYGLGAPQAASGRLPGVNGGAGSGDQYLNQLQQMLGSMTQGNMFPNADVSAGMQINRLSPQEEAQAYETSGYGGLLADPNFGQIDESKLSSYFDLSQPYLFGQGMEGINQQLAAAGFAPSGTGGIGPQAELAARLKARLGVDQANALIQNAGQGATARANLGMTAAGSRYRTLTVPNSYSMNIGQKSGADKIGVQQNPSTIGTGVNTYQGGGSVGASNNPYGAPIGYGGLSGGTAVPGSSYREMTPWEIESSYNRLASSNPYFGESR